MDIAPHSSHEIAKLASALGRMRLTEDVLLEAVLYSFEEAGDCTANDVATLSGFLTWAKPIRFLRDRLSPQGWSAGRHPNLETVISPDKTFQIASATGTWQTGQADRMPSTHVDKGPLTGLAVGRNNQTSFPRHVHPEFGNPPEPDLATWFLLQHQHVDTDGCGEIRVELSLPKHFSGSGPGVAQPKRGYIDDWNPRLILGPIRLNDDGFPGDQDAAPEGEIDIPVERRV